MNSLGIATLSLNLEKGNTPPISGHVVGVLTKQAHLESALLMLVTVKAPCAHRPATDASLGLTTVVPAIPYIFSRLIDQDKTTVHIKSFA